MNSSNPQPLTYGKDSDEIIAMINAEVRLYTKNGPGKKATVALIDMVHVGGINYQLDVEHHPV